MPFREAVADLWEFDCTLRAIPTNGVVNPQTGRLVMGGGVALQARQLFPTLDLELGRLVRAEGNIPFILRKYQVLSFPTKHHFKHPSLLSLIDQSCRLVVELVEPEDVVAMPWPGCGLGGLTPSQVRPLLENVLDDRFVLLSQP